MAIASLINCQTPLHQIFHGDIYGHLEQVDLSLGFRLWVIQRCRGTTPQFQFLICLLWCGTS